MSIDGQAFRILAEDGETGTNVTLMSFVTSLVINLIVFSVILIAFAILYTIGPRDVFNAKWINNRAGPEGDTEISAQTATNAWLSYDPTIDARSVVKPPGNVFKLLKSLIDTPDGKVLSTAGLDAYMHLKILKLALTYFSIISGIFGFVVLVPVTLTADSDSIHITPGGQPIDGLDKISISAVPARSPILWIYCVAVYIFTFALFVLIVHLHTRYLPLRYAWLAVPQASRFSVLALDLPLHIRNDADLYRFIDQLFPGQVHSVCLCTPAEALSRLVQKREELVSRLERMAVKLEGIQKKEKAAGIRPSNSITNMSAPLVSTNRASVSGASTPNEPQLDGTVVNDGARDTSEMETPELLKQRKVAGCIPLPEKESKELLLKKIIAVEEVLDRIDRYVFNYRTYGTKRAPSDPVREKKGFSLLSTLSGVTSSVTSIVTSSFSGSKSRSGNKSEGLAAPSPSPEPSAPGTPVPAPKQVENPMAKLSSTPVPSATPAPTPGPSFSVSSLPSTVSYSSSRHQGMQPEEQRWLEAKARYSNTGVYAPSASAFITFNNLASATIAVQTILTMRHKDIREFVVVRAPEPRDVLWENVGITQQERLFRKRITFALVIGIVILYLPITTLISSLTTVQSLSSVFPGIEKVFQDNNLALAFVEGYLPALLLSIFLALMPLVFRLLSHYGGARSRSEKSFEVARNLFIFRIWIQFIFFVLAGTIVSSIDTLIHEPLSIATMLATAVPRLAGFFAQFYLLGALTTVPLGLLRIWPLIQWIICRPRVKSRREIRELRDTCAGEFDFDVNLSNALVALVIGLTFSAVAPLISVVMVLWTFTSYCVHKHDFLYVNRNTYQTGGSFWKLASNLLCVGMIIFHLTMIGIIGLKESPAAVALIPLPILTLLFWIWMDQKFTKPAEILPLEAARNPEILLEKAGLQKKKPNASANLNRSRFPITHLSSSLPDNVAFAVDPIQRSLTPFGTAIANVESKASHFIIPAHSSHTSEASQASHTPHDLAPPGVVPSAYSSEAQDQATRVRNPLVARHVPSDTPSSATTSGTDPGAMSNRATTDASFGGGSRSESASLYGPARPIQRSLSTGSGLSPRYLELAQRQRVQEQYEPFVYQNAEKNSGGKLARVLQPTPTEFSRSLALEAAMSLETASQRLENEPLTWKMSAIATSGGSNAAANPMNAARQLTHVTLTEEDQHTGIALASSSPEDEEMKRMDHMICYNSTRSVYLRPIFRSSFDTQWTHESTNITDNVSNV